MRARNVLWPLQGWSIAPLNRRPICTLSPAWTWSGPIENMLGGSTMPMAK